MQEHKFTDLEKELVETVTAQRGCILENHFVVKAVSELMKTRLTKQTKQKINKLLNQSARSSKKILCESKLHADMIDNEKGRLGI